MLLSILVRVWVLLTTSLSRIRGCGPMDIDIATTEGESKFQQCLPVEGMAATSTALMMQRSLPLE